jgi:nucleotide-binding universal stress UspA family protein
MREAGEKVLAEALAIAVSAGVTADTRLIDQFGERLGEAVVKEAASWKADLLVVGTHGRRGMGRMLLGSGAEQIIRLAAVPVLVVRNPEGDQDGAT